MEYRMVLFTEGIIEYCDIERPSRSDYYYPIDKEQQLINCIKAGDFESAKKHVADVFRINLIDGALSLQMAHCFKFDLISTIMKILRESGNLQDALLSETDVTQVLFECETIAEMQNNLLEVIEKICSFIQMQNANESYDIKHEAIDYIEKNYGDCNLSISMLGKHLNLAPYYASKLFKEQAGESLLDYINKIRIQKAKELMVGKNLTIEELAETVGFFSVRTFTRTFKKYEGVSPGKFKELANPAGMD